jgi:nucleoside-diphosphate-sugar epimerase
MIYDMDVLWALVDVEDVANAIFKAATTKNLHGKNYLLSSESYRVSDITLMLNNQPPTGKPIVVYNSALAQKDLEINFKPASIPLNNYSA